jgi:hypothetical protein
MPSPLCRVILAVSEFQAGYQSIPSSFLPWGNAHCDDKLGRAIERDGIDASISVSHWFINQVPKPHVSVQILMAYQTSVYLSVLGLVDDFHHRNPTSDLRWQVEIDRSLEAAKIMTYRNQPREE